MKGVVVLGIGNLLRRDDGVGVTVARRVRDALEPSGSVEIRTGLADVTDFLDAWRGGRKVVAIDALRATSSGSPPAATGTAGARPGRIHRLNPLEEALPPQLAPSSSHAFGIREALDLGGALGDLPSELVLIGIEGGEFGHGEGLTPEVESSVEEATRMVLGQVAQMREDPGKDA